MILLGNSWSLGLSNTYVLGPDGGGRALLVNPGYLDNRLLDSLEERSLEIVTILVTDPGQAWKLSTLLKIYKAEVYSGQRKVRETMSQVVDQGEYIRKHGMDIQSIVLEGMPAGNRMWKIDRFLFSGHVFSNRIHDQRVKEGLGNTELVASSWEFLHTLEGDVLILPDSGQPSTAAAERMWNPVYYNSEAVGRAVGPGGEKQGSDVLGQGPVRNGESRGDLQH